MQRPLVKPEHRPYRLADGTIRIGGCVYGTAGEVEDPTGAVWTLLEAMDGTRDVEDLVAHVLARHPAEVADNVSSAVTDLCHSGYVEDAAPERPGEFADRELVRYARGQRFYQWIDLVPRSHPWHAQTRLRAATAAVVGLGGTGSVAALALAGSGVGHLHCVDMDAVELSNLNRQALYTEDDIGRSKVDAAVARLRLVNSDIEVTGQHLEVQGPADLAALADQADVLLLAADQPPEIRMWTNQACLRQQTPWVDSGYHGPQVTATAYVPGEGPCYQCMLTGARHDEPELWAGDHAGRLGGKAVSAVSGGLSGHLAAHLVMALITGAPPVDNGTVYGFNLIALGHHFALTYPRRDDCPACGARP
ncbi:MAG: HesA/MoeB/ThiF family protein [Carbonactinosporaceae bacterium]